MEAMSAGLVCVHSNLGALFETAANWTNMYHVHEESQEHAKLFHAALENAIQTVHEDATNDASRKKCMLMPSTIGRLGRDNGKLFSQV